MLLVVAGLAANYRTFVAAYITRSAFEDATAIAERVGWNVDRAHEDGAVPELREDYRVWLGRGFFEITLLLDQFPARGASRASLPAWITVALYWQYQDDRLRSYQSESEKANELAKLTTPWVEAVCRRPHLKEALVSALIDDYEFAKPEEREAGLAKLFFFDLLFLRESDDSIDSFFSRKGWEGKVPGLVVQRLEPRFWDAVVGDLRHDCERVRAGALALLYSDPNIDRATAEARRMLRDPSELVRLAAAGTLALRGDSSGLLILLWGLRHPEWEVRWWAAYTISRLERKVLIFPLRLAHRWEQDKHVRGFIEDRIDRLEELESWP